MTPGDDSPRTIFALSSGAPPAAIAIVRISGPDAGGSLTALGAILPEPRRATVATLRDPADGAVLDRALLLWTPAPASATGEDVAEIHLHGGRAVVAAMLGVLGRLPRLRPAEGGEFTRRAFENGRLDLLEAEGLADLLAAETESQRRAAVAGVEGRLSRLVEEWRERVIEIAAIVEAGIEFSEEESAIAPAQETIASSLESLLGEIDEALATPSAERIRDGTRVVIAGPPNAGKSTLLNALAGREAAIVSPLPGTTRDIVEAPIDLAGIPLLLCDTAGMRESDDVIETMGIARAVERIATADIVLWLGDPADAPQHADCITIAAKADLHDSGRDGHLSISAVTGKGMATLRELLVQRTGQLLRDGLAMLNPRQRELIETIGLSLASARAAADPLIIAEELRIALRAVDSLSGRDRTEEMLDALFSRFCVGK